MLKSLKSLRMITNAPTSELSDDALLVAFGRGDHAAARVLTNRLSPRLYRMAARMLGDGAEAEDIVQETMLRLWQIAPEWEEGRAKVLSWAWRVASNLAVDRLRKRHGGVALDAIDEPQDPAPGAAALLQDAARQSALQAALAQLPPRQAQAVVLRHLEELTNPEIADIMEIGVEAVESLTARGKRSLAALLGHQKQELGYEH